MVKNIVKNQHYIPESLLRHFTNSDGKFYEVLLASKKIYPADPKSSMSEKFVYEDDGLKVNTLENYFAGIETEASPLIKNVIEEIEKYKNNETDFKQIKNAIENLLPIFIIFYYRSGALLTEFSSINAKEKIPLLSKKILNHRYVDELAATIRSCYKFALIESNCDFLMSDQFLATAALKIKSQFANISNRHIGIKETVVLIPISSSHYVVYWHSDSSFLLKENKLNALNDENVKIFNQTIINNSYIKCIGQKRENIEVVLEDYQREFPSQVYIGYKGGTKSGYINKKEVFFSADDKKAYNMLALHCDGPKYMKAERNDPCPCKSGKKFKKCHQQMFERVKKPIQDLMNQASLKKDIYKIPNAIHVELPIDGWVAFERG